MSAFPSSQKYFAQTIYGFHNVPISNTGSTGSPILNVDNAYVKSVYAYIGKTQNASGSLKVSGSFDGTNYFEMKNNSNFNSGSLTWFSFPDAVPRITTHLTNLVTGSAISGSMYVVVS